uniref:N-acetyltransferase domain-containing protein n=1 Tax=Trichogramma kaykai TaxID=54128 RepID=A0ABD2WQ32_9HYME
MDFRFDVNKIFPKRINKITQTLLPEGFRGDRREYNDTQRLLSRIIDDVGEASAKAQGLNRTITTAQKLRDTDHIVYLMWQRQRSRPPENRLEDALHVRRGRRPVSPDAPLHTRLLHTRVAPADGPGQGALRVHAQKVEDAESAKVFTSPLTNNRAIEYSARTNSIVDSPSRAGSRCNSINGTPSKYSIGRYAASRPPSFMADIIHNVATPEKHKFNSRTCTDTKNFYGDYSLPQNGSTSTGATYYHDEIAAEDVVDRAAEVQANYEADHQPYNTCDEDRAPAGFKEHWQTKTSPPEQTTTEEDKSLAKNFGQLSLDNGGGDDKASNNGHDDKNSRFDEEEYRNPAGEDAQLPYGAHLDIKFYHSPLW